MATTPAKTVKIALRPDKTCKGSVRYAGESPSGASVNVYISNADLAVMDVPDAVTMTLSPATAS
jgi:hypothetical protein